jgi:hypothetical protein
MNDRSHPKKLPPPQKNISNLSTTYVIFEDRRSDSSLLKKHKSLLFKKSSQTALRIEVEILLWCWLLVCMEKRLQRKA